MWVVFLEWWLKCAVVMGLTGGFVFVCLLIGGAVAQIVKNWKEWREKKIYWNKATSQIMDKGGECLFDKNRTDRIKSMYYDLYIEGGTVQALTREISDLQAQLQKITKKKKAK